MDWLTLPLPVSRQFKHAIFHDPQPVQEHCCRRHLAMLTASHLIGLFNYQTEYQLPMYSKITVFWVVAPCRLVRVYRRFRGLYCLHHQGDSTFQRSVLPQSSGKLVALMMEAVQTFQTLVNLYQSTRGYSPEDSHLQSHCRENLKSYLSMYSSDFNNLSFQSSFHCNFKLVMYLFIVYLTMLLTVHII
jgi:hypothetical protein